MNQKHIKKLMQNDKSATAAAKIPAKVEEVARLLGKGIISPEPAKDGGHILTYRNRITRHTLYTAAAAAGCGEKSLKAVSGLMSRGKACYVAMVIADMSDGKLYCPHAVRAEAEQYIEDLRRTDYVATWHNILVSSDINYRLNVATAAAVKADKRAETAREAAKTAEKTAAQMADIKSEAVKDANTAAAMAAVERGNEIAAMQAECEDVDVA